MKRRRPNGNLVLLRLNQKNTIRAMNVPASKEDEIGKTEKAIWSQLRSNTLDLTSNGRLGCSSSEEKMRIRPMTKFFNLFVSRNWEKCKKGKMESVF
ncbi:hypothetical protein Trydic_g1385 [Trypoxylus dichotomus]